MTATLQGAFLLGLLLALAAPSSAAAPDPLIAAAGDIACDVNPTLVEDIGDLAATVDTCRMAQTARLITAAHPLAVLAIGDLQYDDGSFAQFQEGYDRSWGAFKSITYPAVGNHEYRTAGAAGYFDYFGPRAGTRGQGWYSFDIGAWHIVALNGNCTRVDGCGPGSTQERWLAADLQHSLQACTLAFWHQPRFSSATHHSDVAYETIWRDLYAAGADVVLGGHDHDYERFAPQTPDGRLDAESGVREFVVGTGGRSLYGFRRIEPNSEVRSDTTYGVLLLTLHERGYDWRFVPIPGATFTDAGSGTCHGKRGR